MLDAQRPRGTRRRPPSPGSASGRGRRPLGVLAAAVLLLAGASAWASHGSDYIDLTADDATVTHNSAVFTQGGVGAGTGTFDPFLTLQPGGNVDTEQGYNMCDEPVFGFDGDPGTPEPSVDCPGAQFDESEGGDKTHELLASSIPAIEIGGTVYREFFLDSNDTGADPWMSIQVIKLLLDSQPDLTDYAPGSETFGNDVAPLASVAWDMDDTGDATILMNTQGLESGSGVSDISVLVPNSVFPADCGYGSLECDTFVYFYTVAGDPNLDLGGIHEDKNWNTTAGFEEWRIELLPVVSVAKTVDIAFDRTWPWDVTKSADVETIDLFAGEEASIEWTVTASVGTPVDDNLSITGEIEIINPTGDGFAIEDDIDATVVDVDDVLTLGGISDDATVVCPEAFPFEIQAGDTVTCTYSYVPTDTDNGTNTATVTIETNEAGATTDYSDTEDVDFADADVSEIDECIAVTDDNATPGVPGDDLTLDAELCAADAPEDYIFSTDVGPFDTESCAPVTITNTAYTLTNDTDTPDSASDSVDVTCYELTVSKDADTSYGRDYDWDIAKTRFLADGEVDGDGNLATLTLDEGQSFNVSYEVTVTMTGFTDGNHHASGTITITNPAPMAATGVAVSDVISHATESDIAATVDCDDVMAGNQSSVDVPAAVGGVAGTATCAYEADLPNGDDRVNTATAELFGEEYTGTANVTFDPNAPAEEIDECVDLVDNAGTPGDTGDDIDLGTVCVGDLDEGEWTDEYVIEVGPYEVCDEYTFTNRVDLVTTDDDNDTDEADYATYTIVVTVPCPTGCTLTQGYWKTHNDSFHGGAPTDETWELIGPLAENEIFFLSGQTYYQVMWTAPKGNAYYNLAHQYIAAELNLLDGADGSAIATAFASATTLFETYTPAQIAALKGPTGKELRSQFIGLAGTLGSYNEGLIGPGHCDEDGSSAAFVLPPLVPVRRRMAG
jgi:hypothetical protein